MDAQRWETQALRENRARRTRRPAVSQDRRPVRSAVWVTLREASDATGIPVGTLGSWVRRGTVDSYLEANGGRKRWVVDLDGVRSRARELGRPISSSKKTPSPAVSPPPSGVGSPLTGAQIETMIVPIDAWNKMLNQLGNLHEAGQQLAEARERAAKAETEALFLRERLAELRGEDEPAAPPAPSPPAEAETEPPPSPPAAVFPTKGGETESADPLPEAQPAASAEGDRPGAATVLWRYLLGSWKSRRR
ncbi:MAG: hypothetical protein IH850_07790 [Acidobacteria bacterium]|nr:hypothetical protein [Acidobacteriota bacterium]